MVSLMDEFAFSCRLSLEPLIQFIETAREQRPDVAALLGPGFEEELAAAPELRGQILDHGVLERHHPLVLRMMSLLFPPAFWETEPMAAIVPFSMEPVLASPGFTRRFLGPEGRMQVRRNVDDESFRQGRAIRAYLFILEQCYGIKEEFDYPLITTVTDPETGLDRHYKFQLDFSFVRARPRGELPRLSPEQLEQVRADLIQPRLLKDLLPPEAFAIEGFTVVQAVDITENQVISTIERELIDQGSIISNEGFASIQQELRTLFRQPDLVAGISAFQGDSVLVLSLGFECAQACIFKASRHLPMQMFEGTLLEDVLSSESIIRVPDVEQEPRLEPLLPMMREAGTRSLMVAPVYFQGRPIGSVEIKSPRPGAFSSTDTLVMAHLQPVFSLAIKRALEELEHQVQAIIKEKCTSVHPTVEWRFRQAALAMMDRAESGERVDIEPIVFRDVYPAYGGTDVRGSSEVRNQVIAEDLDEHLALGLAVLEPAAEVRPLPYLSELTGRVKALRERIGTGLNSGDEQGVALFMRGEVEPVFGELEGFGPKVLRAIQAYRREVDPGLGTVYKRRRGFERSVSALNQRLTAYLDQEEHALQQAYPHYFERHRTDGVDYLIYLGASLRPDGAFDPLYLKNLRLWQVMVACGMAWHTERIADSLEVPLSTAHLILVQDTPLSVSFRFDEKRFDVEGAYDIRYEIIRSRLDKARVKASGERLTQPGRVAIVYSNPREAGEMRQHLNYLRGQGYLCGEFERLELEDLPGVQGLRALRAQVDLSSAALHRRLELLAG